MELLFFGGRHRYPGETVSWGEYFGEWLEHPVLAALALFCVVWALVRMYGVRKMQKAEKEEQQRMEERYGGGFAEQKQAVNWQGVKWFLLPCVLAYGAGILAKGFLI